MANKIIQATNKIIKWNDGKCMSLLRGKKERCKNRVTPNNDFCKMHKEIHTYDPSILFNGNIENEKYINLFVEQFDEKLKEFQKYLDNEYLHGLLGLNNSWGEVPLMYWYKLDNSWWDIRSLLQIFASQLNQSELERPFPVFPFNPFNRNKISVEELINLKKHIDFLKSFVPSEELHVNIALEIFLQFPERFLNTIRNQKIQYNVATKIIDKFSQTLRYRIINYKDSQGRYCGYWIDCETDETEFEKCYHKIINSFVSLHGTYILMDTPNYRRLRRMIDKLTPEEYVL